MMQEQMPVSADAFERRLLAAHGYLDLSMPSEALAEIVAIALTAWLEEAPERVPRVQAALIGYYQQTQDWEQMRFFALQLYVKEPAQAQWATSLAFATRRVGDRETAREILLRAEREFPGEGTVPYNLANYALECGALDLAREYLRKAIACAPQWRARALADADFRALWEELKES